jgi:hypothetical protein
MKHINLNIDDCALNIQLSETPMAQYNRKPCFPSESSNKFSENESNQKMVSSKMIKHSFEVPNSHRNPNSQEDLFEEQNYFQILKPSSPNKIEASVVSNDIFINNLSENSDIVCNSHSQNMPVSVLNTTKDQFEIKKTTFSKGHSKLNNSVRNSNSPKNPHFFPCKELEKMWGSNKKPEIVTKDFQFNFDPIRKPFTPKMTSTGMSQNKIFKFDMNINNFDSRKCSNPYLSVSCKNGASFTRAYKPSDSNMGKGLISNTHSQKKFDNKAFFCSTKSPLNKCQSPKSSQNTKISKKELKIVNENQPVSSPKRSSHFAFDKKFNGTQNLKIIDLKAQESNCEIKIKHSTRQETKKDANKYKQNIKGGLHKFTIETELDYKEERLNKLPVMTTILPSPNNKFSKKHNLELKEDPLNNSLPTKNYQKNNCTVDHDFLFKNTNTNEPKFDRLLKDQRLKTENYKRMLESKNLELKIIQQKYEELSEYNSNLEKNFSIQKDLVEFYKSKLDNLDKKVSKLQTTEILKPLKDNFLNHLVSNDKEFNKNLNFSQQGSPSLNSHIILPNKPSNEINKTTNYQMDFPNTPHPTYFKFERAQNNSMSTSKAINTANKLEINRTPLIDTNWSELSNTDNMEMKKNPKITGSFKLSKEVNGIGNMIKTKGKQISTDFKIGKSDRVKAHTPKNLPNLNKKLESKSSALTETNFRPNDDNINIELHKFRNNFSKSTQPNKSINNFPKNKIKSNCPKIESLPCQGLNTKSKKLDAIIIKDPDDVV